MNYDSERVDDVVLAVMMLSAVTDGPDGRAWRSIDSDAIDRLCERGLAYVPYPRKKSLVLTPEGVARAVAAAERLLCAPDPKDRTAWGFAPRGVETSNPSPR